MIPLSLTVSIPILWIVLSPFSFISTLCIIMACMLLLLMLAYIIPGYRPVIWPTLAGMILGTIISCPILISYQQSLQYLPTQAEVTFQVIEKFSRKGYRARIIAAPYQVWTGKKIDIYPAKEQTSLIPGVTYEARLKLKQHHTPYLPFNTTRNLQLLANQIMAQAQMVSTPISVNHSGFISRLRLRMHHYFQHQSYSQSQLLSALTVGITETLSEKEWQTLRRTGTIHLISISGLHLTFLALWGFIIIRTTMGLLLIQKPAPFEIAAVLSLYIAIFYALLAGLSLPTQRALIMFFIAMTSLLMRYPILSFQSLATAFVLILISQPLAVLTIGFWLSFTAVAALILIARYSFPPILLLIFTQVSVSLLVIPATISFFGEISLISPVANFFAIPFTTGLILPVIFLGLLLLPLFPFIADCLFSFANQSIDFMMRILRVLEHIPLAAVEVPRISLIHALLLTLIGLILWAKPKYGKKTLLICLCTLSLYPFIPNKKAVSFDIFPVGEGLATAITTPKQSLLFDTGPYFMGFDAGSRIILPSLKALFIKKIDTILLSKYNQQHAGGIRSIRNHFPHARMVIPEELISFIESGISCHDYFYQDDILLITALNFTNSCGFIVKIFSHKLWLIGDISQDEWQVLLQTQSAPDIVLFPNQGRTKHFTHDGLSAKTFLIFSTKSISNNLMPYLKNHQYYNAYDGWIRFIFTPHKISVFFTDNQSRYWWKQRS